MVAARSRQPSLATSRRSFAFDPVRIGITSDIRTIRRQMGGMPNPLKDRSRFLILQAFGMMRRSSCLPHQVTTYELPRGYDINTTEPRGPQESSVTRNHEVHRTSESTAQELEVVRIIAG